MICLLGMLLMFGALAEARSTACSYENRLAAPDDCIERIRDAMTNVDLFWFGNGYYSRCPQELAYTIDCFSTMTTRDNSLASLFFWPGFYNGDTIVQFLNVTFTSPPGSYEGCNTRYDRDSSLTFTLDPLSDETVEPWDVREQPEVTWEADPDMLYTLMVKDAGYSFMHGLFINIPGLDISRAEVVLPYHGPMNFREIPNPYVFLLFEQSRNITMDERPALPTNELTPLNVSHFTLHAGLTGPVAVNWLLADYDPYSVELLRPTGVHENCSPFVTEALEDRNLTYASPSKTLPVFMTVAAHTSDSISVEYCCTSETFREETVVLDPITSAFVEPALMRSGVTFNITLNSNRMFPNRTANFQGRYYSLIVVEPDSPSPQAVGGRPLLRWLAINMAAPGGQLGVGVEVVPYLPPLPTDPAMERYYYFLLYEQPNGALELVNDTERYTEDTCGAELDGRCQFDITSFLETHDLNLAAASWFTSRRTDYVSVQTGLPQAEGCAGRSGYSNPCRRPTSGSLARQVAPALRGLLLVVALSVLVSRPTGHPAH